MDNLILMGYMGSGKSTMAVRLSYKLRRTMVDTDKLIEQREHRTISEIFAAEGEEYFRKLETETLRGLLAGKSPQIISLGGGTPLREENRAILKKLGKVIYIQVSPETVYERLKDDTTRPLLACEDPMQRIREMLAERDPIYRMAADVIVCGDGKDQIDVLHEILEVCK